ncbi:MAG: histidinol-phosphatase [bacterium]
MSELSELKEFCGILADSSAEIIRGYFRQKFSIEEKKDLSPVTIADKKAEELMRKLIMKEFPNHGIVGEEFGIYKPEAEYQWILDPIDGTKSFICGAHTFGTMIGVLYKGEPILGVINQPVLKEYMIGDNKNTYLNGEKTAVRYCNNMSEAVLLTTDHLNVEKYQNIEKFNNLIHMVKLYRMWGDCYGYLLLAAGYTDIMIDPIMNIWDLSALIPIIKGAGGVITDFKGGNAIKGESIIAASPVIHKQVLEILN